MKKLLILALLSLIMVACSQEEPIIESATEQLSNVEETQQLCDIAKALAKSEISSTDLNYIATGVSLAVENGLDEVFYIKELLGEDSKIVPMKKQSSELEIMKFFSSSTIMQFYEKGVNSNKLMIYWPFYENWDGESKPVISFTPENQQQQHNIGYYLENGELKTVEVNLDYAMNNPVWIICLSPIRYNQLPDFNNPKRLNLGETLNIVSRENISILNNQIDKSAMTRSRSGEYLGFKYIQPRGTKYLSFVGNSITYRIYREQLLDGVVVNCDCILCGEYHVPNPIIVTFTLEEFQNGEVRELRGGEQSSAVYLSIFKSEDYNLRFCVTSTIDMSGVVINPPIYPINPFSFEVSEEESVIIDKIYDKDYFMLGENLDSTQYIKWCIFYDYMSSIP